jgi:poly [ADP-ribose] polymerase 2/3/4
MKLSSQRFGTNSFPSDYDVTEQCTLNKTDLEGNNNKFYIIEAHTSKDGTKFRLYSRYGRVGADGVEEERIPPQSAHSLKDAYDSLKREKTSASKGYREVAVAQSKMGSSVGNAKLQSTDVKKVTGPAPTSKKSTIQDQSVADLVARIYRDAGQAVKASLSGTVNSTGDNPLGALTKSQVAAGRQILQDVQQILTVSPRLKGSRDSQLIRLTNDFYSMIPQQVPLHMSDRVGALILNTADRIDDKEEMLKLLEDVEVMSAGFAAQDVDDKYAELGCTFTTVVDRADRQRISDLVTKTQSDYHRSQGSIKVRQVWKVGIKGQADRHAPVLKKVGNVKPLFHGSRDCNIAGICKRGLLMRPPGAYITGSMFGNGLYFADQSSKSTQYSTGRFGGGSGYNNTHFLFVADVALGKIKEFEDSQSSLYAPPKGYDSVMGKKGRSLIHNEFIVYSTDRNILQYLVEFEQ